MQHIEIGMFICNVKTYQLNLCHQTAHLQLCFFAPILPQVSENSQKNYYIQLP